MKRFAAMGALKLSYYFLNTKVDRKIFDEYSNILDIGVTEENIRNAGMDEYNFGGSSDVDDNCRFMCELIGDNPVSRTLFELACLLYMKEETSKLLKFIYFGNKDGVCLETAARVTFLTEAENNMDIVSDAYDDMELILLADKSEGDIRKASMKFDYILANHILGVVNFSSDEKYKIATTEDINGEIYAYNDIQEQLALELKGIGESAKSFFITGARESGRFFQILNAAKVDDNTLVYIDYEELKESDYKQTLRKMARECRFVNGWPVIRNVVKDDDNRKILEAVESIADEYIGGPVFFTCAEDVKLIPFTGLPYAKINIAKPSFEQSFEIWTGFANRYELGELLNVEELAVNLSLTSGQVERVMEKCRQIYDMTGVVPTQKEIYGIGYTILDDGRYENIKRVESKYTLRDLQIDETNRKTLIDIINQAKYRRKVYDTWHMSEKYSYGKCISAIFTGGPGTGKTMAVHALANELGLDLYKVDLSQLVDKYVGETQKRLEEVFKKAENSNMILFFDEADAIMSKRNEVKDSNDKYSNTEIAYILQRIEEFDGIVLLATNYLQNIDQAFMRRIKYVVYFDLPDVATRKSIWMNAITDFVPLSDDMNFDFLAENFEFSGGNIKNIVLNATFLAAAADEKLGMKHMVNSIYKESVKDKRVRITDKFGPYIDLLDEVGGSYGEMV